MGRYQYELSNCIETCCCYNIPNTSNNTFVNAGYNCNYTVICLANVSCTGSDWNTATGFIHWGLKPGSDGYFHPICYCDINYTCFGRGRRIVNNFPTDRIVIVGIYGFQWTECKYSSTDCCSRLLPVAQRQMFILPSGQCACFHMGCAIHNLSFNPDGSCIYPGYNQSSSHMACPYFFSVESYPLPVLNSNGFIGENGCNTWVKPTAICSTGSANSDSHTIPIYCNGQLIDCDLSYFHSSGGVGFWPAIKGSATAPWSLGGKLSRDANSSARDTYVLVSSCGSWCGKCGVPDNLAMVIANNTFPTGGCRWSGQLVSCWNRLSYALGMIECCNRWNGSLSWPMYGPECSNKSYDGCCYCMPLVYECSRICFNIPPTSDKMTAHMTCHYGNQSCVPYYSCVCAYSAACFTRDPYVCNPLGYWTLNWNNGNSYYAVNTHCT